MITASLQFSGSTSGRFQLLFDSRGSEIGWEKWKLCYCCCCCCWLGEFGTRRGFLHDVLSMMALIYGCHWEACFSRWFAAVQGFVLGMLGKLADSLQDAPDVTRTENKDT
jgi:hypothetical protein